MEGSGKQKGKAGAPKEAPAPVTFKKSSKTADQIRDLTPDYEFRQVALELNLSKPEESCWIAEILKLSQSEDPDQRVFALWRLNTTYNILVQNEEGARGAECASYLMQRGFLEEIKLGLPEAIKSGQWYIVPKNFVLRPKSLRDFRSSMLINRMATYADALYNLAVDSRATKFILKELPDIISLLDAAFSRTSFGPKLQFCSMDPEIDSETSIISLLPGLLTWSNTSKKELAERPGSLSLITKTILADFANDENVQMSALLVLGSSLDHVGPAGQAYATISSLF